MNQFDQEIGKAIERKKIKTVNDIDQYSKEGRMLLRAIYWIMDIHQELSFSEVVANLEKETGQ